MSAEKTTDRQRPLEIVSPIFTGSERVGHELQRLRNQAVLGVMCFGWLAAARHGAGVGLAPMLPLILVYYLGLIIGWIDTHRARERDARIYAMILLDCVLISMAIWMGEGPNSPLFFCFILLQGAITVRFPGRFSIFAMAGTLAAYPLTIMNYDFSSPLSAGPVYIPLEVGKMLIVIILPAILRPLVARQIALREQINSVADRLSGFKAGDEILSFDREGEGAMMTLKKHLEALSARMMESQAVITGRATLLEAQVEESMAKLREEMERAQSSDRLKTEFLNMINHELRTPLHHIMGFSEILERQAAPEGAESRMARIIKSRATELYNNLDKLTKLSTLMSNDRKLDLHPVNLADMAKEIMEIAVSYAMKKDVRVESSIKAEIQNVMIDYEVVKDILRELLSNAVKFSPQKGLVRMALSYDGATLGIEVADQGKGFLDEDGKAPDIGLFRQRDGGLEREFEGFGVGLYFVQQLVLLHKGELLAASQPGGGSVFTIRVPAAPLTGRKE